jgi:hypothetical protein
LRFKKAYIYFSITHLQLCTLLQVLAGKLVLLPH